MKIKSVRIQNFRSIEDLQTDFDDVTSFIGPNGAGKSNILRALDWFFNGERGSLTEVDVFRGSPDGRVRVQVEFEALTAEDRDALGRRYCPNGDELTFTAWRTWDSGVDKITGKALALPDFEQVRRQLSATEKRSVYNALKAEQPHLGLPACSSAAAVEQAMNEWELRHPEQLVEAEVSDTHFFGFSGQGKLAALFDYVFVSADLRAHDETSGSKDSLLSRILQRAVQRNELEEATVQLVERFTLEYAELSDEHLSDQLGLLASELSAEVASYTQGREILLRSSPASWKPAPSAVDVIVSDNATETPVRRQGHGFQRTLLLAALTVLSRRSREQHQSGQMFLAIEEPELFQHPTQARAFSSVLRQLASDDEQRTQVAYATHSPHFVEPRYFDQVRRVSSTESLKAADHRCTRVTTASVDEVKARLDTFVSSRSIERRWEQVCLKYLPDALFAESVILVEGDEDAAILEGMGSRVNQLAVSGICVAPVSGKTNMLIPFTILTLLGIPALMVVDNDSGCGERMRAESRPEDAIQRAEDKNRKDNRAFCRFVGADEEDYPVGAVSSTLTFVPDTLETLLASDLPGWDLTRKRVIDEGRGVDGKNAATYALAARECSDTPGKDLSALLRLCAAPAAA